MRTIEARLPNSQPEDRKDFRPPRPGIRARAAFPIAALAALALLALPRAAAQQPFSYWPGAVYDPAIPTHEKVLGHAAGERITRPEDIVRYMRALAAATPGRMKVFDYGKTWEGREMIYAAVASEANIRRLDEIRAAMKKLADPRKTPEAEARKLMENLPAVLWLGYGVHGNEISPPDAALLVAYHLLAARNDKVVQQILGNVVVLIDPLQNPDGRARFVHHFEQSEGIEPNPSPVALEHSEAWPGGRTNHYHFDMNRDWFAMTQPETQGRVKALLEWFPLVFVDLHEMGADSTYYFAPEAVPFNPHLTGDQKRSLEWFGRNNARWFDEYGISYFTREVFDAFYPGYGASWPAYFGAVAMTYEQASARGLLMRKSDETVFHFRDTVRNHFVASVATAETAAGRRRELIENFYRYRRTAIEEGGSEPVRDYVLARRGNVSAVDKLAALLAAQGVEVRRATAPFSAAGRQYPAGSYSIPLAQPAKRLARVLLDREVAMEEAFIKEQERRRAKRLPDEIYDVTAWSLPLLYGVECDALGEAAQGSFEAVQPGAMPSAAPPAEAKLAYLAPWGESAAGRLLAAALRRGLKVWSANKSFTHNGRAYPRGTLIFRVGENPAGLRATLAELARKAGAEVVAADSSWMDEGVDFGSRHVAALRAPSILIAWDQPVGSYAAGHTRFVLERQFHYPTTPVRVNALATADLSRFDVIILPDGNYGPAISAPTLARIKAWVSAGGTLIGMEAAVAWMADPKVGLLELRQEERPRAAEPAKKSDPPEARVAGKLLATEADYLQAIQAEKELPDSVAGVLLRARLDPDHYLTAGAGETVTALVNGRAVFTPIRLDKGVNAAVFLGPDELLASGYLWKENREQLAYKPLLIAAPEGRGQVIAFTASPAYRAYMDGMNMLLLNAVFRAPAYARRGAGRQ